MDIPQKCPHKDLERKPAVLEKKYDHQFRIVFEAIWELMTLPDKCRRKIGFDVKERKAVYGKKGRKRKG